VFPTKHQSIDIPLPSSLTSLHSFSQLIAAGSTNHTAPRCLVLSSPCHPLPPPGPLSSAHTPFSYYPHRAHRHTNALNETQFLTSTDLLHVSAHAAYQYLSQSISKPQPTSSSQPTTEHRPISAELLTALLLSQNDLFELLLHSKELSLHQRQHRHVIRTVGTAGCHNTDSSADGKAATSARDEWFLRPEQKDSNNKPKG